MCILPVGRTFYFCTKFKISPRNNLLTTKWFGPFTLLFYLFAIFIFRRQKLKIFFAVQLLYSALKAIMVKIPSESLRLSRSSTALGAM